MCPQKFLPHLLCKVFRKDPSILYEGDTMPLLYWKIMRGYMLPQYLQASADKNITYSIWKKILYGRIG